MISKHFCDKGEEIEEIKKRIIGVKKELDAHRAAQQKTELERAARRQKQIANDAEVNKMLSDISCQLKNLVELNIEYTEFKTAWKVGKKMGLGLAVMIATLGVITGGVIAIKEWVKR